MIVLIHFPGLPPKWENTSLTLGGCTLVQWICSAWRHGNESLLYYEPLSSPLHSTLFYTEFFFSLHCTFHKMLLLCVWGPLFFRTLFSLNLSLSPSLFLYLTFEDSLIIMVDYWQHYCYCAIIIELFRKDYSTSFSPIIITLQIKLRYMHKLVVYWSLYSHHFTGIYSMQCLEQQIKLTH